MEYKEVIELKAKEAKSFFMENENFCNFDIPDYFDFSGILNKSNEILENNDLKNCCKTYEKNGKKYIDWPKYYDDVNYLCLNNKGSFYSWRPLQLINPLLYIDLLNTITEEENWKEITDSFNKIRSGYIECISIPVVSNKKQKAIQINRWWNDFEQKSLAMALEYNYIFSTDISNCYSSIYTHSIEWALCGREESKKRLKYCRQSKNLGQILDTKIRNLNSGQTNGIPQGSTLMDFIAEIVLGYIDSELIFNIEHKSNLGKKSLKILRYRDDYHIFTNEVEIGYQILQILDQVLRDCGLLINSKKTIVEEDILTASIKKEKLQLLKHASADQYFHKEALRIYLIAKENPGSGAIISLLEKFYKKLKGNTEWDLIDPFTLIAILSNISIKTPTATSWIMTIISILICRLDKDDQKPVLESINKLFCRVPHTTIRQLWLQRIAQPITDTIDYNEPLTKRVLDEGDNSEIWNFDWLKNEFRDQIKDVTIRLGNLYENEVIIQPEEVDKFNLEYNS